MDFAAGLEGDGPVAVKLQLVFPAAAFIGEGVRPQKQHRINEAALHFDSHLASLADGSHQAPKGEEKANMLRLDRKSTRLNSSHSQISYAVFCLKKKKHGTTREIP